MRLIDADELRRRIIAFSTGSNTTYLTVENIVTMINKADTVDAVPGMQVLCGIRCNHVLLHPSRWDEVYQRFRLLQPRPAPWPICGRAQYGTICRGRQNRRPK